MAASTSAAGPAASSSSDYTRPIPAGKLPVYDEALAYIEQHKNLAQQQMEESRKRLASLKPDAARQDRSRIQQEIAGFEVGAYVNDPEVRWRFRYGLGDMSQPVYRYLAEQAWRENGDLGILMQRITQMNVVPDILGRIAPSVDLRVAFGGESTPEPGSYLKPSQTVQAPRLQVQVFHPEERQYTLLMLDPDSPYAAGDTFKTKVHWAVRDVTISAADSAVDVAKGRTLVEYIPPHPEKGTRYHRYTLLLLEQRAGSSKKETLQAAEQDSLDVRSYAKQANLRAVGITFFRQIWDASVSDIFKDILRQAEPTYGKAPRTDKYRR